VQNKYCAKLQRKRGEKKSMFEILRFKQALSSKIILGANF